MYHLRDALTKIREYHETEDEQRSSIDGSFRKKMSLFYLPTVRKCTDGNDFDLRQLRREDITVYVGVNAEDMSRPMTSSTCSLTSLWKSRYEKTLTLTRH
ncbi:type IV secretory system conjugative DNA transfer family protein (plasmid) [Enterobacter hormaechei]